MFQSMTGYGSGKVSHKGFEILCEIKSVNNRYVDISFRGFTLPNDFEEYVKIQIKKKFLRGSFEVKINDNFPTEHTYEINETSLKRLKHSLVSSKYFKNNALKLSDIKDIPGLLIVQSTKRDTSNLGKKALNIAIKNLVDSRIQEGKKIEKIILAKVLFLINTHKKIDKSADSLLKHRIKALRKKMKKEDIKLNDEEISSELSNIALKHDISEELERIKFHLDSLQKFFKTKKGHGKKIDFILQELFREVNTLSVKLNKPDLKDLALTMKLKVEELREQAQNLE